MPHKFETQTIHAGQEPDPQTGAIMTPVYLTSTYVQDAVGKTRGYEYSRTGNPTRAALEACLAALEGAKHGLAFASGMAATDAVLRLFGPGDHILAGNDVYGGTFRLFDKELSRYGFKFDFVNPRDPAQIEAALRPETRLVWLETPTNPYLGIVDLPAVAKVLKSHSARPLLAVDNTFATPYLQQPLALGADFVIHSTTKYLGGHSDVVGGAVLLNDDTHFERLAFLQNGVGAVPGPMDCFLVLRGLKTLHVRMDRHAANAAAIGDFLANHPKVETIYYPFHDSHPQQRLAQKQMRNGGGMVSFEVRGGAAAARKVAEATRIFALAESLGGVESIIEVPAAMTHLSTAGSPLEVKPNLVRLSVGIEHLDDLLSDLDTALKQA
ncbi:MAG: cystathionine gamma-synthase [Chloroflexi bacterium]|nr:cystathionine gamma-synthase [Chloroflexota bacterium]MQC27055.1 cystathionine gamma-synthase [Chloroflexota bacterium]